MIYRHPSKKALLIWSVAFLCSNFSVNLHASENAFSDKRHTWPEGRVAISLSYDDSLPSQLDNALPILNRYNVKASFYVLPNSESFQDRLDEWQNAASAGHELGNHSIKHSCSASIEGRDWVAATHNLDTQTAEIVAGEIRQANVLLEQIDGQKERTFTIPCGDQVAGGDNYVELIRKDFVAIKGEGVESGFSSLYAPAEVSGAELIAYVEQQALNVTLINILFHGVGGDYLSVSSQAHEDLLSFLAANQDKYWVDTYLNIMKARELSSDGSLQ